MVADGKFQTLGKGSEDARNKFQGCEVDVSEFDLVIRGGTVVTSSEKMQCDIGIADGKVAALGPNLEQSRSEIDASGLLVLPGGVEGHCHIEQRGTNGVNDCGRFLYRNDISRIRRDDHRAVIRSAKSGSVAAAGGARLFGMCKAQSRHRLRLSPDYQRPTPQVLGQELPSLIKDGYTSFKVYMTYDRLKLDDMQMLEVLSTARQHGAFVMIHAENHDMISWLRQRLLDRGHVEPKFHAVSHPRVGEGEAANRAIALSRLLDIPILIVHVSSEHAMDEIREAQTAGLKVFGETCAQYICLTADDLDRDNMEGAKFCCSPPLRDKKSQEAIWRGIRNGTFQVFSSDHAPYSI